MRSKKILKYLFRLTSMMFHRHTKIFVEAHTIDLIKFFLFHFKHHRLLDQSAATQFSTNLLGVQKVFGELSITCHSMDCQFEGCLFRQIRDRSQIFPRIKGGQLGLRLYSPNGSKWPDYQIGGIRRI